MDGIVCPTTIAPISLADGEIASFLENRAGYIAVEVSTAWCFPCHLLRPIIRKLAHEFADRMTLVEIDGDAAPTFRRTHGIRSFPQVLVFKDGKLAGRQDGLASPEAVRAAFARILELTIDATPSAAELTFRSRYEEARAAFDAAMKPASAALRPFFAALDAMEEAVKAEVAAGRLSDADAKKRMEAENERIEAQFRNELDTSEKAKDEAQSAYAAAMSDAIVEFAQAARPEPSAQAPDASGAVCAPGDRFCSVRRLGAK